MDSWLPSDTFRRAGFGHVLRGREHVLILERGVNMVWLDATADVASLLRGEPVCPQPRYRLPAATLQLADMTPTALGYAPCRLTPLARCLKGRRFR